MFWDSLLDKIDHASSIIKFNMELGFSASIQQDLFLNDFNVPSLIENLLTYIKLSNNRNSILCCFNRVHLYFTNVLLY